MRKKERRGDLPIDLERKKFERSVVVSLSPDVSSWKQTLSLMTYCDINRAEGEFRALFHICAPQFFFWRSRGRHVRGQHELLREVRKRIEGTSACRGIPSYLEVYAAISVLVEDPEYLLDEDLRVSRGQNHAVHVQDLALAQQTVGAVDLIWEGKREREMMLQFFG